MMHQSQTQGLKLIKQCCWNMLELKFDKSSNPIYQFPQFANSISIFTIPFHHYHHLFQNHQKPAPSALHPRGPCAQICQQRAQGCGRDLVLVADFDDRDARQRQLRADGVVGLHGLRFTWRWGPLGAEVKPDRSRNGMIW